MIRTIQQGAVDFSSAAKVQTTWRSQEAVTFVLEGTGATLLFLAVANSHFWGAVAGLALLAAAGLLLLAHLGNPKAIIYLLTNIRHSWMSRGAALIPLLMVFGTALVVLREWLGSPLGGAVGFVLLGLLLLLSIFAAVKSALVLGTFPAITFWSGRTLPLLFGFSGLSSGLALYLAIDPGGSKGWQWLLPACLVVLLIVQLGYFAEIRNKGDGAKISLDLIGERHFAMFWGAGIGGGLVVPLLLSAMLALSPDTASSTMLWLIAALRIGGDIAARDVFLKVGVYDKVI